jgi:hypothetical protein
MQKARADPAWLAAQEAKLKAFVGDLHSKALTLANLTKAQADVVDALAPAYSLTTRPMAMLMSKHRLQLLKGVSVAIPEPDLSAHTRVLTDADVTQLQAKAAAATFEMQCAAWP